MARMTHFYLQHDSPHRVEAFTVDGARISEGTLLGLPVVPFEDVASLYPPDRYQMGVPIAFSKVNNLRAAKYHEARAKGYELISYVSSRAVTWPGLAIGDNCFIYEGSVVGPYVRIGSDVIIAGSSIGHDSVIGDHSFLAAHAVVLGNVSDRPVLRARRQLDLPRRHHDRKWVHHRCWGDDDEERARPGCIRLEACRAPGQVERRPQRLAQLARQVTHR